VLRVKLFIISSIIIVAMLLGPLSFVLAASKHPTVNVPAFSSNSETTAAAQIVAADFLSGRPTLIPVANGNAQDSQSVASNFGVPSVASAHGAFHYLQLVFAGEVTKYDSNTTGKVTTTVTYQLDSFLVATPTAVYTLTVPMLVTDAGPVLGALPSMTQTVMATSNATDPLDYSADPGYTVGNGGYPADATYIQNVVSAWAVAFASDNQSGLQAVAKYATQPLYPALGGFTAGQADIQSEVTTPTGGLYVRVAVHLTAGRFSTMSEYDLLLSGANTASPAVISWGPAGAAPLANF
jgi:hypothetical protein